MASLRNADHVGSLDASSLAHCTEYHIWRIVNRDADTSALHKLVDALPVSCVASSIVCWTRAGLGFEDSWR